VRHTGAGDRLTGLTTQLTEYLADQLIEYRKRKGVVCPGEAVCETTFGKPLNKYRGQPVEEVCGACSLVKSKPRFDFVGKARVQAMELDELNAMHLLATYPVKLTNYDYACLRSLHRARRKFDEWDEKEREKKQDKK